MAGLNPFWLKDPTRNVSSAVYLSQEGFLKFSNIISGATQSNCSLPWTNIKAETRHNQRIQISSASNFVDLIPSEVIEVTQTRLLSKTLSQSLSELVWFLICFISYWIVRSVFRADAWDCGLAWESFNSLTTQEEGLHIYINN